MGNFTVKEEYTDEIKKLEPTTPGHADYFNEIYQKLINNDAYNKKITAQQAEEIRSHIDNKTNPHGVTKAQVGLGDVPNVNTNDQVPTFTESTALNHLISGEKLSVAFSKIAKAITTLINHVGNKNNPHTVTKAQVGLGNVANIGTNDQTPTFTQATTRSNLVSGEKISVSLGKVMKWFADLKTGAFSTVVNNDTTTAEGYVADARIVKTHGDEIDALKKSVSDGKKSVAAAITAQGVNTAADAEFSVMATNINTVGTNKYNAGVAATKKGNATAGQVLTGYTFTNASGVGLSGSMPNRGVLNWNPSGATSYSVPAGYYSGGTLNSTTAYNKGVADADNRPNGNSVNYVSGYNAGVAAADNRANPNSVNYQTGYNDGVAAGRPNISTRYYHNATDAGASHTHDFQVYVPAGYNYLTFSYDVFAGYNNVAPISVLRDGSGALYSTSITTRGSGSNIRIGVSGANYIIIRVTMNGASTVDMTAVLSTS